MVRLSNKLLTTATAVACLMVFSILVGLTIQSNLPLYYLVVEFFGVVLVGSFVAMITQWWTNRYARAHPLQYHYSTQPEKAPTTIKVDENGQAIPDGIAIEIPHTISRMDGELTIGTVMPLTPKEASGRDASLAVSTTILASRDGALTPLSPMETLARSVSHNEPQRERVNVHTDYSKLNPAELSSIDTSKVLMVRV